MEKVIELMRPTIKNNSRQSYVYHCYKAKYDVCCELCKQVYGQTNRTSFAGCKKSTTILEGHC